MSKQALPKVSPSGRLNSCVPEQALPPPLPHLISVNGVTVPLPREHTCDN